MKDDIVCVLLRIAGGGLALLALLHLPISRRLEWRQQATLLTPLNAAIFHVHNLFIVLVLIMMALPCLFDPQIFILPTRAGSWFCWLFCGFWAVRLYCQWFLYDSAFWRGKKFETAVHAWFTCVWLSLTLLYGYCGLRQNGW